jgi:phosphatidylserine decarboxylase
MPRTVARHRALRRGKCVRCGECCSIAFRCPYLDGENHCTIYERRPKQCGLFPITEKDLGPWVPSCGHYFEKLKERDVMRVPLTRYGLAEIVWLGALFAGAIAACAVWFPPALPVPILALGILLYFFRDPKRRVPPGDEKILAPADGKVVEIAEVDEQNFIGGRALRIGIFLSILDVHINRAPCAGRTEYIAYEKGKFLNALRPKAARENENNSVGLVAEHLGNLRVLVRQISGVIARRIVCECRLDQKLDRGEKFGMIKFGSRTELYLPLEARADVQVKVGQKVKAGESVLAIVDPPA